MKPWFLARNPVVRHALVVMLIVTLLPAPIPAGAAEPGALGPADDGRSTIPAYPTDAVVRTDAPIVIRGTGGVTDQGQATYSIPLRIPAGGPALSLQYNGTGNDRLGVGWHLAGLSAIAPCRKTFVAHGLADGIDWDRLDAYCLDGVTLVPDSNQSTSLNGSSTLNQRASRASPPITPMTARRSPIGSPSRAVTGG